MIKVRLKKLNPRAKIPQYATSGSSGLDLFACLDKKLIINPKEVTLIPTGIALEIPEGYEGQIRPRSGLSLKKRLLIPNSPGTIDSDYRGEIKIIIFNWGDEPVEIEHGQRIAQLVFQKVCKAYFEEVEELSPTNRNTGGFGHTGL